MRPERWAEASPIVERLLDASTSEKAEVLAPLRHSDPALAEEVEALLLADESEVHEPAASSNSFDRLFETTRDDASWIGESVAGYTVESVLGTGGMSTVFKAVRTDGSIDRPVALKILGKQHDAEARRRFDLERRMLARLEHPGIARLYDGGTTSNGVPYLVMEWVDGRRIDTFCDQNTLGIHQRIELFLELSRAVSWAHRHLIVHRDIKPANVLVTSDGEVRLLDFGIGKPLDPGTDDLTTTGLRPMTVAWASPEQIRGQAVSVASDVYSLGTLLYWLLTGCAPCGADASSGHDLQKAIVDDAPTLLSRCFAGSSAEGRAQLRGSTPESLTKTLSGDLEAILDKALAKAPGARYHAVADLARDLEAFLDDRPIAARPEGGLTRLRRLVRRHRAAVLVTFAVGSGLVLATLQSARQSLGMERQRDLALAKRAEADQMTEIALELLQQSAASGPESRRAIEDLLDRQAERLDATSADDAARASALHALGVVQRELGRGSEADALLTRAAALRIELFGENSLEHSESLEQLATLRQRQGSLSEAERLFRTVLENRQRLNGSRHADTAMAHNNLGLCLWQQGRFAEAEPHLRSALQGARRSLGSRHPGTLSATSNLALVLQGLERRGEAEQLHRVALQGVAEVFGTDHPRWATTANNLATTLRRIGKVEEAAQLQLRVVDVRERHFGSNHPDTASALQNLGFIEMERGNLHRAETLMRRALDLRLAALGADHELVESSRRGLSRVEALRSEAARIVAR